MVFPTNGIPIYSYAMNDWREIVRMHMEGRLLSVAVVADKLGITEGGLRHWLNKTRTPSIDQFIELCAAIDLDPCIALCAQLSAMDRIKKASPIVAKTFESKPEENEAHKKYTAKVRAFRSAARRFKLYR